MNQLDFQTTADILSADNRISILSSCGIFSPAEVNHPLFNSALIEILIYAADLTGKAARFGCRVDFQDDVSIPGGRTVKDVTELLSLARSAACHVTSGTHTFDKAQRGRVKFSLIYGKGRLMKHENVLLFSDIDNDFAFFFGDIRVYYDAHIMRASVAALENLALLMDPFERRQIKLLPQP
jgi:hypothetical protein